jgi:hypothetical protein
VLLEVKTFGFCFLKEHELKNENGGDGGVRTLDTLLGYAHLANECLQPLGHVSEAQSAWRLLCTGFADLTRRREQEITRCQAEIPTAINKISNSQKIYYGTYVDKVRIEIR